MAISKPFQAFGGCPYPWLHYSLSIIVLLRQNPVYGQKPLRSGEVGGLRDMDAPSVEPVGLAERPWLDPRRKMREPAAAVE
jgi:hypothetical protein